MLNTCSTTELYPPSVSFLLWKICKYNNKRDCKSQIAQWSTRLLMGCSHVCKPDTAFQTVALRVLPEFHIFNTGTRAPQELTEALAFHSEKSSDSFKVKDPGQWSLLVAGVSPAAPSSLDTGALPGGGPEPSVPVLCRAGACFLCWHCSVFRAGSLGLESCGGPVCPRGTGGTTFWKCWQFCSEFPGMGRALSAGAGPG